MRVFFTTLGCRLNEAEIETWSRSLAQRGHDVVNAPDDAQVMVVNTCAVTGEAARKSRKLVGGLHRRNPTAPMVLTGCYSELSPAEAGELAGVDLVVPNADKERLVDVLLDRVEPAQMPKLATAPEQSHVYRQARTRAFIKVQDGCRNRCTFCIVTIARGIERSRPIADIVAEINGLSADGVNEVVLTGVHLGGYGSDLGSSLSELCRAVLAHTDVARVRLSSLEPWDLPADFFRQWEHPRLMPHLHLPVQSGSDSVLRRMARRCSTDSYAGLVETLREAIPDVSITTDIIVGFPGETETEWRQTVDFVERIEFSHCHIFSYSRREGTTAAEMADHVPAAIKRERSRQLHSIASRQRAERLERYVGTVRLVLWEGAGDLLDDGRRRYGGYTDNYLRVETRVEAEQCLENRIAEARLISSNGETLQS